jgi:hypothetical protein
MQRMKARHAEKVVQARNAAVAVPAGRCTGCCTSKSKS